MRIKPRSEGFLSIAISSIFSLWWLQLIRVIDLPNPLAAICSFVSQVFTFPLGWMIMRMVTPRFFESMQFVIVFLTICIVNIFNVTYCIVGIFQLLRDRSRKTFPPLVFTSLPSTAKDNKQEAEQDAP